MTDDSDFETDVDYFLADLDKLDRERGDWRDHLPTDALYTFFESAEIRALYGTHAAQCAYCWDLIVLSS